MRFCVFLVAAHSAQWALQGAFARSMAVRSGGRKQEPGVETRPGSPSSRQLQAPPSSHILPRVPLEEGKNIGRNSTRPETDGQNIVGGARSGREPERKEGFPLHESGVSRAKPQGWEPLAGQPSGTGGWGCRAGPGWWCGRQEVVPGVQAHRGARGRSAGWQRGLGVQVASVRLADCLSPLEAMS